MFNWNLRVPYGYGTSYRTLREMEQWLLRHYHPEYVRRLIAWLHFKNGAIGIGGGWRAGGAQPDKPGFAPEGRSFHQDQNYNDGFTGACAVDLVAPDGPDGNNAHDGVTWAIVAPQGSAEARRFGVHCNVGGPDGEYEWDVNYGGEPWHIQPVEIDGWQSWWNAGRPAPRIGYPIPAEHDPYNITEPIEEGEPVDFHPVEQFRAADTRVWPKTKLEPRKSYRFKVDALPADAVGMLATITCTQAESHGHLTVARPGDELFKTSCLNYGPGDTLANTTFVPLKNQHFDIASHAPTHVVVDVLGFYR